MKGSDSENRDAKNSDEFSPEDDKSLIRLIRENPLPSLTITLGVLIVVSWVAPAHFVELLKVIVSWPGVLGILAIVFRREISEFLKYLVIHYKTRGGDVWQVFSQSTASSIEVSQQKDPGPGDEEAVKSQVEKLIEIADGLAQDKQSIIETAGSLLQQKQDEVFYWWHRYLSCALVFRTKWVLRWFCSQQRGVSKEWYQLSWAKLFPEPGELEAIFAALASHGLIRPDVSGHYTVSEAGIAFLRFLNQTGEFPDTAPG